MTSEELAVWQAEFEVFGKVQKVFFRKYTREKAIELRIKGFVRNTTSGSVVGVIQGPEQGFKEMKYWLSKVGSPKSSIQRVLWKDEKTLPKYTYKDFTIKKD